MHIFIFLGVQLENPIKEEKTYVKNGDNMTLSCSGVINATVLWAYMRHGDNISIEVAINGNVTNHEKYSATNSGVDGDYAVTVHRFSETSDAGNYYCGMSLDFELQKEFNFTTITPGK